MMMSEEEIDKTENGEGRKNCEAKIAEVIERNLESEGIKRQQKISEVLSKVSERKPEKITEMMALMGGSIGNPIHNKMNEEHITQVLDLAKQHDEREFILHKEGQNNEHKQTISNRRYIFASFVIIIGLILTIMIVFKDKTEVLTPVLSGIGGLLTGALGGYGFGKSK